MGIGGGKIKGNNIDQTCDGKYFFLDFQKDGGRKWKPKLFGNGMEERMEGRVAVACSDSDAQQNENKSSEPCLSSGSRQLSSLLQKGLGMRRMSSIADRTPCPKGTSLLLKFLLVFRTTVLLSSSERRPCSKFLKLCGPIISLGVS